MTTSSSDEHDQVITADLTHLNSSKTRRMFAVKFVTRWWQHTVVIELTGSDVGTFLQGLSTADIDALQAGFGCDALFLDNKSKIIAPCRIFCFAEPQGSVGYFIETTQAACPSLMSHIKRYKLRSDVVINMYENDSLLRIASFHSATNENLPQISSMDMPCYRSDEIPI